MTEDLFDDEETYLDDDPAEPWVDWQREKEGKL